MAGSMVKVVEHLSRKHRHQVQKKFSEEKACMRENEMTETEVEEKREKVKKGSLSPDDILNSWSDHSKVT